MHRTLQTFSHHNVGGYANVAGTNHNQYHLKDSGVAYTWRSYAGDWLDDDPAYDWWVHGNHWKNVRGQWGAVTWTYARDCNLSEW
ncbi:MAG: hypothetical protein Cons2KO_33270 [Congregibacter sp.]